jgi:hypothetical protein
MTCDPRYDAELLKEAGNGNRVALDIIAGKRIEDEAERVLTVVPASELSARWNANVPITAEVKDDRKASSTGNVFIEFEKRVSSNSFETRPSGIALTEAEVHVLHVGRNTWVVVGTEVLKEHARQAVRAGRTAWGGDDRRFHGALVSVSSFLGTA